MVDVECIGERAPGDSEGVCADPVGSTARPLRVCEGGNIIPLEISNVASMRAIAMTHSWDTFSKRLLGPGMNDPNAFMYSSSTTRKAPLASTSKSLYYNAWATVP